MSTQDADTIAARIDTATAAGWNLRALLLRLLGGDAGYRMGDGSGAAIREATAMGLGFWPPARDTLEAAIQPPFALTTLGREVAERLRPEPWRAVALHHAELETGPYRVSRRSHYIASCGRKFDAERIADLLTKADAEDAKQYKPG
jgi:hypothetical protein